MKKKWIYNSLIVAFSLVFVFCIYKIASYYIQLGTTNKVKDELVDEVVSYEQTAEENPTEQPKEEEKGYYHAPIPKSINFNSLKAKNSEVVGWIFNENGVINYPVMHTDKISAPINSTTLSEKTNDVITYNKNAKKTLELPANAMKKPSTNEFT